LVLLIGGAGCLFGVFLGEEGVVSMAVYCDPDCIGSFVECCYRSQWPMGLVPVPYFSFKLLFKVMYTFLAYFAKDVPMGFISLVVVSVVGWLCPDFVEIGGRLKKRFWL